MCYTRFCSFFYVSFIWDQNITYDLGCGYFLIDKLLFQGGLVSVGSHSHSPLVFHIGLEKQKQEVNRKIILWLW